MVNVDDRLALLRFKVDRDAHIKIEPSVCAGCPHRACLAVCPAGCYQLEGDAVSCSCEGCLECGTCLLVCDRGAIDWHYPRGGFGACYRLI